MSCNESIKKVVIDTSAIMNDCSIISKLINLYEVIIPIVVVYELDNLKKNDFERKRYQASQAISQIEKYKDYLSYDLICEIDKQLAQEICINPNDDIIITCAKRNGAYLISADLDLRIKAVSIGVEPIHLIEDSYTYKGFKEVVLSDEEMSRLYSNNCENLNKNLFDCIVNEYIIIKNKDLDVVDRFKWNGEKYIPIYKKNIYSQIFGSNIKPKDDYQRMVVDSIMTNTITSITGKAGSGKSLLALSCAMNLIEKNEYDTLVILFNPTKTKEVADMGYYSGSALEKALQNSIGYILTSKFGDRYAVDILLNSSPPKLKLISMADIRGMEIKDNEILYITECQNTSSELLKLCLSRASQGCKIIIEGDYLVQVDHSNFTGYNNGLRKLIHTLKGESIYGHIELQNIWRSKIAELVDKL